jgi:PHD/YefM family antitoxin component YafN of YafNO toxin-antitoxin module
MQAVSISGLKHNPAEAVRQAKSGPVVVLNRDNPDAIRLTAAETRADLDTLEQWLQSSSPTPAPPIPVISETLLVGISWPHQDLLQD